MRAAGVRDEHPAWERPGLVVLLVGTLLIYVFNLAESGWANPYYAAAAQSGSRSWEGFFFGSFDLGGGITVDKTPASLWVTSLSVRIFGLSSGSILVPQALMGVATVAVLFFAVRRWYGASAAMIAGVVLALTPVAALMFRFNNPDALLTLLLTIGAYATLRAVETANLTWVCAVGALVGFAVLTKMLQALLIIPAFAGVYLLAADTTLKRRLLRLCAAAGSLVVAAGWWIVTVSLIPAAHRPYIGGSQTNSILELTLGYNGLGRLTGDETGSVHVSSRRDWGDLGLLRMWGPGAGGQIGWFLIAALVALAGGVWMTRRTPRTDRTRAGYLIWGGWLVLTALVFSFMRGIFHEYYTVVLAPPIAALVGMGAAAAYAHRGVRAVRVAAAAVTAATGVSAFVFLQRTAYYLPPLRWVVLIGLLLAAAGMLAAAVLPRRAVRTLVAVSAVLAIAGPAAFVGNTITSGYMGSIVRAGPLPSTPTPGSATRTVDRPVKGQAPRGAGGLLYGSKPPPALVSYLTSGTGQARWLVAAMGAQRAAGYQLALGEPVMAIGGFNGSDPWPTLAQFQQYVAGGQIRWLVDGPPLGKGPGAGQVGGSTAALDIVEWVRSTFAVRIVGAVAVYDLTTPR